jgi:hypothetical protein
MPILIGNPGIEYAITPRVALFLRTGFGPGVGTAGVGFALRAMMGATIKL